MAGRRFTTTLIQDEGTEGCAIKLPFDAKEAFGRARVAVTVRINGFGYCTTTCPMAGAYWIPVNKATRTGAGIAAGDRVTVSVELDTQPRVVKTPRDFAGALRACPSARAIWQKLSYSHQKAHVDAIEEAKKPETRQHRIKQAVERLRRAGGG